jgi:hypothetical protein
VTLAVGASEFSLVLLLTILIVVPIATVAFFRAGKGLEELGKGRFAIDRDDDLGSGMSESDPPSRREAELADEVRQMVEAADFRSQARGDGRLDVEGEIERLLAGGPPDGPGAGDESDGSPGERPAADTSSDPPPETGIRAEVRQLVIANNERRLRRGDEPLDVESEVDRRLEEWS